MINIYALITALFYRIGGASDESFPMTLLPKWLNNIKIRDGFIPLVVLFWIFKYYQLPALPLWQIILCYLISFGAMWASLSTYLDEIFGYDNFYFHGLLIGLSLLPFAYLTGDWFNIILRAIILGIFMGGLNWLVNKLKIPFSDLIEEFGRGGAIAYSLLLLTA